MRPQEAIERDLSRLEEGMALSIDECDQLSWALVSSLNRARGQEQDRQAWPIGTYENPIALEVLGKYISRLSEIVDKCDDSRAVAMFLFPIRIFKDSAQREFLVRNLRKWLGRDQNVVYNLLLCLDEIGEEPFQPRASIGAQNEVDWKANDADAKRYLKRVNSR